MLFQTVFVYSGLSFFMLLCTWHYRLTSEESVQLLDYRFAVYALLAFALVFGMRYGVGTDHLGYLRAYKLFGSELYDASSTEKGFVWLTRLMVRSGFHYSVYFSCIAFIQISLFFFAFRKHVALYPFLVFSIMLGCTWLSMMNGLRQQIAVSILVAALPFLNRKQWYVYALLILVATYFHRSAYILFLLLPLCLLQREIFSNRKLQFILLVFVLALSSNSAVQYVVNRWGYYAAFLDYDFYIDNFYEENILFNNNAGAIKGLGFYINLTIVIILVYLSSSVKSFFSKGSYNLLYDLFFLGILYNYAFFSSGILQRINYYFFGLDFIWIALTLMFLYKKREELHYRYWGGALLVLLILRFMAVMYKMFENTAAFVFFWQKEFYDIKTPMII
ncbi:MAG: EpsG family protein [Paraprevotella sp.]|nr:EpsG family protein [Paraprevotella sp.]MBP3471882.1 EpsG family protein [Paraprevotella sp.]